VVGISLICENQDIHGCITIKITWYKGCNLLTLERTRELDIKAQERRLWVGQKDAETLLLTIQDEDVCEFIGIEVTKGCKGTNRAITKNTCGEIQGRDLGGEEARIDEKKEEETYKQVDALESDSSDHIAGGSGNGEGGGCHRRHGDLPANAVLHRTVTYDLRNLEVLKWADTTEL